MRFARASILLSAALGLAILTGCTASVPLHSTDVNNESKQFAPPSEGKAGIYVFRDDEFVGSGLYKDIYIDGVCLGETAPGVFFYTEVEGNQNHVVATESEFSPNQTKVYTEAGKHYFFEQYIKWGVFVGGADVRQVDETMGKAQVSICQQAIPGTCSNQ